MIGAADVHKKYGDVAALSGVSVDVAAGQALGLVGPNGAGKSSLLRILCGVSRPDAGSAWLDGHNPAQDPLPARRRLGCLPEHPPLFDLLTGQEQLAWAGRLYALPDSLLHARIEELAAALDLGEALPRRIGGYSKGMRQKLAFAGALLHDPRLLILDEPFEGVDVVAVDAMKGIIRQFAGQGAAVLLSSHILGLVEDVCTEFTVLSAGRVVFSGDRHRLENEAAKLTREAAGRPLEAVFLDRVAPHRVARRLTTLANGSPEPPPSQSPDSPARRGR
jgi:ABC-2 type transport system ATP-binding protein